MRNYTSVKTLADHARDQNDRRQKQLQVLLSKNNGDDIVIDRETLISIMHRIGNSSYMIGLMADEIRDLHMEFHIANQQ